MLVRALKIAKWLGTERLRITTNAVIEFNMHIKLVARAVLWGYAYIFLTSDIHCALTNAAHGMQLLVEKLGEG